MVPLESLCMVSSSHSIPTMPITLAVSTQYTKVKDRQTPSHRTTGRHRPRLCTATRGINWRQRLVSWPGVCWPVSVPDWADWRASQPSVNRLWTRRSRARSVAPCAAPGTTCPWKSRRKRPSEIPSSTDAQPPASTRRDTYLQRIAILRRTSLDNKPTYRILLETFHIMYNIFNSTQQFSRNLVRGGTLHNEWISLPSVL